MFSSNRILALNIGASKVLLAEFNVKSGESPELVNYGFAPLGAELEGGDGLESLLSGCVRQIMKENGIRPAPLMVCLSGQMVFPRFVRLPAVAEDKLMQMVEYEVEQNVPFPLDEIVWNHQFIGDTLSGEQAVMIVAAKIENIREITSGLTGMGLEPEVVDVAPMALYNCMRYNAEKTEGCTVLLDIGARSTNLIFIEDEKIYSRCIPVAGNAITQELAKGFGISFEEAERKKCESGFVSLGGVYAVEDPDAERMSKMIRNVVTRLHAEISRSINFYRSQQGGSAPTRLILTGGSAVLPQLDTFFEEKLHVSVEFLNPFNYVAVGGKIDPEQLSVDAFILAETVGLVLRRSLTCPIEINLMPPEISKRKSFRKRIPYFGLAILGIVLCLGVWTMNQKQMASIISTQCQQIDTKLREMKGKQARLNKAERTRNELLKKADAEAALMEGRTVWLKRIDAVRRSLYKGVWLTDISPIKKGDQVIGLQLRGYGWQDKMEAQQAKSEKAGRQVTAVEELRDRLRQQSVFGDGSDDVRIIASTVGKYVTEFTIEAKFTTVSGNVKKDVKAR